MRVFSGEYIKCDYQGQIRSPLWNCVVTYECSLLLNFSFLIVLIVHLHTDHKIKLQKLIWSWAQWQTTVTPALGRWEREDKVFGLAWGYMRSCLNPCPHLQTFFFREVGSYVPNAKIQKEKAGVSVSRSSRSDCASSQARSYHEVRLYLKRDEGVEGGRIT